MKTAGIVCEYNPLHNGHIYHLNETRRLSGADALVLAMSGNFVQRGEPAILDKWERARLAVSAGADLVLEIPTLYCLADAGRYAKGGIGTLKALGICDFISFGSESGDLESLSLIAERLADNKEEIDRLISENKDMGLSFPTARELAYEKIFGDAGRASSKDAVDDAGEDANQDANKGRNAVDAVIPTTSNDILAIEYLKQISDSGLKPITVKRIGASYNEELNAGKQFQCATAIRKALEKGEDVSPYVPADVLLKLNQARALGRCGRPAEDRLFDLIRYAIISSTAEQIDECPSGGEGLGNRIKEAVVKSDNLNALLLASKSKRYTYTRLSRLSLQILLGMDRRMYEYETIPYIRILAVSERGRELLSIVKKKELNSAPLLTNINKNCNELSSYGKSALDLDIKAVDLYNMICARDLYKESDYCKRPYIKS
jgi:predicted nucleotidyltransferase